MFKTTKNIYKNFGILFLLILFFIAPLSAIASPSASATTSATYRYTKTFDTTSGSATGTSVATDSGGNVYVTGYFSGTVVFDGVGGSDSRTDNGGNSDSFLTKYNANGSYGWTKIFDSAGGYTNGAGVTADHNGNIYVTGFFQGTIVFDGVGGSDSRTDTGSGLDNFLTKYNANGSYGWTKIFDSSIGSASGTGVTADDNGNIYETGYFTGTIVFDGIGGSDSRTAGGGGSSFLTKYNADGSYGWTRAIDVSVGSAGGLAVATNSSGDVYVTGNFQGTVVFDGVGGSDNQTSVGNDVFLTKYNANGSYGFTRTFDATSGQALPGGIGIDDSGNIYIAGSFSSTVVFDGVGGSDTQSTTGGDNAFLTKYNANGSYGFTRTFDTTGGGATGTGVAADSHGNIYLTGWFNGTVVFNGPGGSDSQTENGGNQYNFVTKFTPTGGYGWTKTFAYTSGSYAYSLGIAIDTGNYLYITGQLFGTATFDGLGGSDTQTDLGGTGDDFLTSYNLNSISSSGGIKLVPGAPDTGFGIHLNNPITLLLKYGLVSLSFAVTAFAISKRYGRKYN